MNRPAFLVCASAFALCGCSSAEYRWSSLDDSKSAPYQSEEAVLEKDHPIISVSSTATPADPAAATPKADTSGAPALRDLSDHGQAGYFLGLAQTIAAEKRNCKTNCAQDAYLKASGVKGGGGDDGAPSLSIATADARTFKRTLVVNVLGNEEWPFGDRLARFTVKVVPGFGPKPKHISTSNDPDNGFDPWAGPTPGTPDFRDYIAASTQSSLGKFGTVDQSTSFDLKDQRTAGSSVTTPEISSKKEVTSDIVEATIPLNVNVGDGNLYIQKHGNVTLDITGNTVIALSLYVPGDQAQEAFVVSKASLFKDGTPLDSDKASMTMTLTQFGYDGGDIEGAVSLTYLFRHVVSGNRTFAEGDDEIALVRPEPYTTKSILLKRGDIVGTKWVIAVQNALPAGGCDILEALPTGLFKDARYLYFNNQSDADTLANWLNHGKPTTMYKDGQLQFWLNNQPLDRVGHTPVFTVMDRDTWMLKSAGHCSDIPHPAA